ncbi:TonB-dependent receptor [Spongiivirga citrea]|uniref:TonB-dependent receptor n=1 Tax=Spongiivirga citrea TaxID=1481457 RepID=A0A6M0CSW0_9FLAO|nr:TonB-dependent receptor [Spongiivirga citrea]NER18597.1 TonB-dependent receptor [Spongiivirga citrea]
MIKIIKINLLFLALTTSSFVLAQEEEKKIDTEVINVVKPYTPTVSDAFKIKKNPTLNDSTTTRRKIVNYRIFSQPVASTFTPAKGKAEGIQKAPREKLYDTYLGFGLGNFNTAKLDFYTAQEVDRDSDLNISLKHHSSQGGIDNVILDDKFFDTDLELKFIRSERDFKWEANGGFQHQLYNWYGIATPTALSDPEIAAIDPTQNFISGYLGGEVTFEDGIFRSIDLNVRQSGDSFKSSETRVIINPTIQFPIENETITATFTADYLTGKFDRDYFNNVSLSYQYLKTGLSGGLTLLRDDVTLNLGAAVYYGYNAESKDGDVFIYPRVTASYRLVDEYVILFGGVEGDLIQNNYYQFYQDNQFVSPTLNVSPTDAKYDAYVGMKGKISANVGYSVQGGYSVKNDHPFFISNASNNTLNDQGYSYGNSFGVIYDNLQTISFSGKLSYEASSDLTLSARGTIYDYKTDNIDMAWNLPEVTATAMVDYQINKNWYLGGSVFYTGARQNSVLPVDPTAEPTVLKSFLDINSYLGYRISEKFNIFMNINNLANQNYQKWENYPVQGFQFLAGITYGFDLK